VLVNSCGERKEEQVLIFDYLLCTCCGVTLHRCQHVNGVKIRDNIGVFETPTFGCIGTSLRTSSSLCSSIHKERKLLDGRSRITLLSSFVKLHAAAMLGNAKYISSAWIHAVHQCIMYLPMNKSRNQVSTVRSVRTGKCSNARRSINLAYAHKQSESSISRAMKILPGSAPHPPLKR
jgi:hypothetical protein